MPLRSIVLSVVLGFVAFLASTPRCHAQWLKQSLPLATGWNAVYLHVDTSYATLDELLAVPSANAIREIWLWTPSPAEAGEISDPRTPTQPDYWAHWTRGGSPSDTLTRLHGNVACLVRTTSGLNWEVTGRPVVPVYRWTTSGLNFIGFPTVAGTAAPSIDSYFVPAPDLRSGGEFYSNFGGDDPTPALIDDLVGTRLRRGQAFWVKSSSGTYNRYYAPFEVETPGESGVRFGETAGQISLRLRNTTRSAVTVTLRRLASDPAPTAPPVAASEIHQGPVPVLVRGESTGDAFFPKFAFRSLAETNLTWTLQPKGETGSEVEIVLGCDRQALTGNRGALFASILRFTDAAAMAQIDVPVSARVGSHRGLWVGNAMVTTVEPYLNAYYTATNAAQFTNLISTVLEPREGQQGVHYEWDASSGRILTFGGGTWTLEAADLRQPGSLLARLKTPTDAVSFYLRTNRLKAATREALDAWAITDPPPERLSSGLVRDLNDAITGPELWNAARFAGVVLRSETQGLTKLNPSGWNRERLHRLLLEDAYPDALSRRRPSQKIGQYARRTPVSGGQDVPRPYPLRLILHQDPAMVRLLQKVHLGFGVTGAPILTPNAANLDPGKIADARRISAVHLPVRAHDQPWNATSAESLRPGATVAFEVRTAHDDPRANPFLHRFHPDHDGLTAELPPQPAAIGEESFGIRRLITLTFDAPEDDFDSRTRAASALLGRYVEEVTLEARAGHPTTFASGGEFQLNRVSDIETLTP
ncbi:MAG: hypothetical protein IT580_11015 [Verrucomicrobiales bacterium]|nr:hypothetical protein [Verrucomicrobiales bacterium]